MQLGTILSDWFWLLFLSVRVELLWILCAGFWPCYLPERCRAYPWQAPAYGFYKLWGAVIQPWLSAPRAQQQVRCFDA